MALPVADRWSGDPSAGAWSFARLFSLPCVCGAAIVAWLYLLLPCKVEDPDIWWHLRNAGLQWQTHCWLDRDLYSFTAADARWIDHEWLAELPFYWGWRLAGQSGLFLVTLAALSVIFLLLFRLAFRASKSASASLAATFIASLLATVSFGPRTLLFGWICLLLELTLLEHFLTGAGEAATGRRHSLLAMPLLFVLWINLHGSCLIGLVLFAVFIFGGSMRFRYGDLAAQPWTRPQRRQLSIVLLLSIAALFVNPYGWHLVLYPFDLAFHQKLNTSVVEEWQPLSFQTPRGFILLGSLALLFVVQLLWRHRWTLIDLTFSAIGIYAACRHTRFLFLAGILLAPRIAGPLATLKLPRTKSSEARPAHRPAWKTAALNAAMLAAILLFTLSIARIRNRPAPIAGATKYPVAATAYLQTVRLHGRLFNEYLWGGYLEYFLPEVAVFIDSRMDIYERNGTLRDYLDIIRLHHSLALLDRYQVRYVLFEKNTPLVYLLQQTHAWKQDYDDGQVVLLERDKSDPGPSSAATEKAIRMNAQ